MPGAPGRRRGRGDRMIPACLRPPWFRRCPPSPGPRTTRAPA